MGTTATIHLRVRVEQIDKDGRLEELEEVED